MTTTQRPCVLVLGFIAAMVMAGCGNGKKALASITVSVSPITATVQAGGTAGLTATVTNDSANRGVTWSVSCSAMQCGSVSPTATASGAATTYTAPASPPTSNLTVTVTATSVTDTTKSASATVTVSAIVVSVSPTSVTVQSGSSAQFTATVQNDPASAGVTWTLTQSGTACSPACGSVLPTSTASGAPTTYTAPTTAPTSSLMVTLTATSVTDTTKSALATITVPAVTVTVAPPTATVDEDATQIFTAMVSNTTTTTVTWTLTQSGTPCSPTCGSLSSSTSNPVSYIAPGPPGSTLMVTITATSTADPTKSGQATITVPAITVSVSPTTASVIVNGTQTFTAAVANDPANAGVTWTLTQSGSACSPTCGSLSGATSTSVTYTAPGTVPSSATVMLTATSVTDTTKSAAATITVTVAGAACGTGSESLLAANNPYVFLVKGFDSSGPVGFIGIFTPDGKGGIASGVEDINRDGTVTLDTSVTAASSSYSIGSDFRGCLNLAANGVTTTFRFALTSTPTGGVTTKGRIIEFDDTTGMGTRGSGILRAQSTTTTFSTMSFNGQYGFELTGTDSSGGHAVLGGNLTADGTTGTITGGVADGDDNGLLATNQPISSGAGAYTIAANGRGTLTVTVGSGIGAQTVNVVLYMIDTTNLLAMSAVPLSSTTPFAAGQAYSSPAPFSSASLNGFFVFHVTGRDPTTGAPSVTIGTVKFDGVNTFSGTIYQNTGGTFTTTPISGTYSVDTSTGRVTLTSATGKNPVLYVLSGNVEGESAFLVGTDGAATSGRAEFQSAGTPNFTAFAARPYFLGSDENANGMVTNDSGTVTFTSTMPGSGTFSGTEDESQPAPGGLKPGMAFSGNYTISPDGSGNFGASTMFVTNSTSIFLISDTSPTPVILVFEQ